MTQEYSAGHVCRLQTEGDFIWVALILQLVVDSVIGHLEVKV